MKQAVKAGESTPAGHQARTVVSRPVEPADECTVVREFTDTISREESRSREILEIAPDGILVVDASGLMEFVNGQVEKLLGYKREELLGKNVEMLLPERYRKSHVSSRAGFTSNPTARGMGERSDLLALCKDGRELPLAISLSPLGSGSDRKIVVMLRDVQDEIRTNNALRLSQDRLRCLLEGTCAVPWEADVATWLMEYIGPQAVDLLGFPLEEWTIPGFWEARIHQDDRERVVALCKARTEEGVDHEFEYRMVRADGRTIWIQDIVTVVKRDGVPDKLRGFFIDISERKHAEEQVRRHRDELAHVMRVATMGELTASIAHEINQPLSSIVNNARAVQHLLRRGNLDIDDLQTAVTSIAEDGLRAGEVIRRLRAFLRKGDLLQEPLDLSAVVRKVVSLLKSEIVEKNISMRLVLPENLPQVSGDQVQLQQVVLNLILNAFDSMASVPVGQRSLEIETSAGDVDCVCLWVRDNGKGIEAKNIDRIFDPFFSTKKGGLGMGLAINRSIIEGHGGRLWATPNQVAGVTFCCCLPADKGHSS